MLNNVMNLIILVVLSLHLPGKQKGYWLTRTELPEFVSCQVGKCGSHLCYWVGLLPEQSHLKKPNNNNKQTCLHNGKRISCYFLMKLKQCLSKHKEFQNKTRLVFWFRFILTKSCWTRMLRCTNNRKQKTPGCLE